ncbi:hypothetical protein HHI36_021301 [Cryptolaemus montrouzieri]|uniref:Protein amnionless n=1 Tax=Cryptolaemus montrouzieri TaxID=559131 RepID=A0ABD2MX88_9CUCU
MLIFVKLSLFCLSIILNLRKCLKLKEINGHHYLNPENWDSPEKSNPAIPDNEKIPCLYDKIKFPNGIYSGVYTSGVQETRTVSAVEFLNETFDRFDFEAFKSSDVGRAVFDDLDSSDNHLSISDRKCVDPTGCICNWRNNIQCPPREEKECLSPVAPFGFCHKICGAFVTFKPIAGFSLGRIQADLRDYGDVRTHVSKIGEDRIQVVFAEDTYSGDSVIAAKKFYEKLQDGTNRYKVTTLSILKISGSQTSGDSSLWIVLLSSLLFVLGLYGLIFYVYGDHSLRFTFGFNASPPLPLSSTYRARFSPREDESGLIFDNQSLAGSVMNLDQSFDNPLYGQVSTSPNITEEKIITRDPMPATVETFQSDKFSTDPLSNLNKLNQELKEEIGSHVVQDLSKVITPTTLLESIPPLIQVDEDNDDTNYT